MGRSEQTEALDGQSLWMAVGFFGENKLTLTSEHDTQQGEYVRVPEVAHGVHLTQEVLLRFSAGRFFQNFNGNYFDVVVVSVEFSCCNKIKRRVWFIY